MCHPAASHQTKRCHAEPRGSAKLESSGSERSWRDTKKALSYRESTATESIRLRSPWLMADNGELKHPMAKRRPETRQAPSTHRPGVGERLRQRQRSNNRGSVDGCGSQQLHKPSEPTRLVHVRKTRKGCKILKWIKKNLVYSNKNRNTLDDIQAQENEMKSDS